MKRLFFIVFYIVLCLGFLPDAGAQRTAYGMHFAEAGLGATVCSLPSGVGRIAFGQYLSSSLWKAGVRAADWNQRIAGGADGDVFDHVSLTLHGDWLLRLFGTYGRTFSIYAGAGIFLGANRYGVFRPIPDEYENPFQANEFIYGAEPSLEAEAFPFRRLAVVAAVHSPFTFASSLEADSWHLAATLGLRLNL